MSDNGASPSGDRAFVATPSSPQAVSPVPAPIPSADADEEETYQIGRRDGYEFAIQTLDIMTGGDGEYRYCTDHHDWPNWHCPDAGSMQIRIVNRFNELPRSLKQALATYDTACGLCPFTKRRTPPSDEPCPECRATASEPCGKRVCAAGDLIEAVRRLASGTDARSDETAGLGPQGDGPAPNGGDAQTSPASTGNQS